MGYEHREDAAWGEGSRQCQTHTNTNTNTHTHTQCHLRSTGWMEPPEMIGIKFGHM